MTEPVTYRPIGIIRTAFPDAEGMPIQATAAVGVPGRIEIDAEFVEGLADLDGFSHLILVYHLHRVSAARLTVTPFVAIQGSTLEVEDVDMVDGTPLLDIKPYVPAFDERDDVRVGWFTDRLGDLPGARADDRFRS